MDEENTLVIDAQGERRVTKRTMVFSDTGMVMVGSSFKINNPNFEKLLFKFYNTLVK